MNNCRTYEKLMHISFNISISKYLFKFGIFQYIWIFSYKYGHFRWVFQRFFFKDHLSIICGILRIIKAAKPVFDGFFLGQSRQKT